MKLTAALALLSLAPLALYAIEPENGAQKRVTASAEVLSEILHAKDRGIPEDLMAKAQCVGIVPSLKRAGFIVMNRHGVDDLMKDKFTLGGDASAMAGPVGRSSEAQTDALMRAEILGYSRAHGIFAGVALEGSTLRPDNDDNRALYGRDVTQREILTGRVARPAVALPIYAELNRYGIVKRAAK